MASLKDWMVQQWPASSTGVMTTGTTYTPSQPVYSPSLSAYPPDLTDRVEVLEKNATHINVAKDQEERIVELENAVTKLMAMVEQLSNKDRVKEMEEILNYAYAQKANKNP